MDQFSVMVIPQKPFQVTVAKMCLNSSQTCLLKNPQFELKVMIIAFKRQTDGRGEHLFVTFFTRNILCLKIKLGIFYLNYARSKNKIKTGCTTKMKPQIDRLAFRSMKSGSFCLSDERNESAELT